MEPIWRKIYPSYIPHEIDTSGTPTVVHMIEQAFEKYGPRPAFFNKGTTISYAQLEKQSLNFAAYLQKVSGRRLGDRVALMCTNILPFPVAMAGILRAGLVQVSVNPFYKPRELKHQLNDAHVETIVIANSSLPTLLEILPETPVREIVLIGNDDLLQDENAESVKITDELKKLPCRVVSFVDALKEGSTLKFDRVEVGPDDLAFLQYTGGTTGLSKGAMLGHSIMVNQSFGFKQFCGPHLQDGEEVVLTASPMYHILGLGVNCLGYMSVGGQVILVDNPRDMPGLLDIFNKFPITAMTGVNTLYNGILHTPGVENTDFSHLKLALGGGTAIQESISNEWKSYTGRHIKEGWGMSEAGGLTLNPIEQEEFKSSIGIPYPSVEVKLLDNDDNEVGIGQPGEICVRGPMVMKGYWGMDNSGTFTDDGYFRSGDIAVMDERGFFKIVDRKKDVILVSGFNVYPIEIEGVVTGMPGVKECACVGVPDDKTGEAARLFVVPKDGVTLTEEEVEKYCRKHLTGYKVPKQIRFIGEIPKSAVGKMLRRELRDVG